MFQNQQLDQTYVQKTQAVPTPPDVFDEFRAATNRFHQACKNYSDAQRERSEAEKAVQDCAQRMGQLVQGMLLDPTVPQNGQLNPGNPGMQVRF